MAKHGGVKDSGEYFVINPTTRKVTVPHAHKSIGSVGDHNSEQITFMCPQIIDGHDISQCADRYVTWVNVYGEVGHDKLHLVQVEQGTEGMIYLSWTIRDGLTVTNGVVQFSVHFEDKDLDGTTLYRWSTATCKDCDILDSVNAVLGAYQAVYMSGDTLVFADYNAVKDGVLSIGSNGFIPEGILTITENGTHDVGSYAEVDVQVAVHDDLDFVAENIKKGVEILNIVGTYDPIELKSGTIIIKSAENQFKMDTYFTGKLAESDETFSAQRLMTNIDSHANEEMNFFFLKDSWVILHVAEKTSESINCNVTGCRISRTLEFEGSVFFMIKIEADNPDDILIEIKATPVLG